MNEAETRAELIDPALKAAGWGVVEGSRIRRKHPIVPGRIEGHGKANRSRRVPLSQRDCIIQPRVAPKAFGATLGHAPPIYPQPQRGCSVTIGVFIPPKAQP